MQINEMDAQHEKRILAGMITNDAVVSKISPKWVKGGMFRIKWANTVGGMCIRYYRKYGEAPRANIEALFDDWANDKEGAVVDLIDNFLVDLSGDYENYEADDLNVDYIVDTADAHFNEVSLEKMADAIKAHITNSDLDQAAEVVAKWSKVSIGTESAVNVLGDEKAMEEAFEDANNPLIVYPGAMGEFFGNQLARDEFLAITGKAGIGKTWWLVDIAWMGIKQNRRVAFFEVGDMSRNQIERRFLCRASGHPTAAPYDIEVPTKIYRAEGARIATVETKDVHFKGPLTAAIAKEACRKKTRRRSKDILKLSCHPNMSVSINDIESTLAEWERDGWIPDIVVIDYADDLMAPTGYKEGDRESINATWKIMRGLSQKLHCLLVTASQGDAGSYDAHVIRKNNFSDDRRKNDHPTAGMGLNQTEEEKALGIYRINLTKKREQAFSETRCVHVAGCLSLGRPHMLSTF